MRNVKKCLLAIPVLFSIFALTSFTAYQGNPSANGGGTAEELGEKSTFAFNAVEHNDGTVNGHLVYQFRGGDIYIHMDLDCMRITGNRATLGGVVTSVSGNTAGFPFITVGARAAFTVEDNGQGSKANPDRISDLLFGSTCAGNFNTYIPISGNIQVKE